MRMQPNTYLGDLAGRKEGVEIFYHRIRQIEETVKFSNAKKHQNKEKSRHSIGFFVGFSFKHCMVFRGIMVNVFFLILTLFAHAEQSDAVMQGPAAC